MSIHNVLSWPISTLLLFSRIGKPVLDRYGDMRANKSRVHTGIINSGLREVNNVELLLYGGQSQGYDGD